MTERTLTSNEDNDNLVAELEAAAISWMLNKTKYTLECLRDARSAVLTRMQPPTHETGALREALENISTVRPLEHFPAVTALAYCREKAIEALKATREFQEVIVGEYEADGKINMASSPLPEGTKLYARLPLRHSEKAGEPQCSGLCSGLPDANCPVHGLKATLSEGE